MGNRAVRNQNFAHTRSPVSPRHASSSSIELERKIGPRTACSVRPLSPSWRGHRPSVALMAPCARGGIDSVSVAVRTAL